MTIRATYASIDLDALRTNLRILRQAAAPSAICAVVKANAYGHGSIPIALTLADEGIEWLAVALVEEGIRPFVLPASRPLSWFSRASSPRPVMS